MLTTNANLTMTVAYIGLPDYLIVWFMILARGLIGSEAVTRLFIEMEMPGYMMPFRRIVISLIERMYCQPSFIIAALYSLTLLVPFCISVKNN